jgi:MFS family permease
VETQKESLAARTFASLGYRNYRLVWLGSVTEHLGEWMEIAAILWLVHDLTRSPLMLTVVGTCRFLPRLIFPVIGGMAADKMDRYRLLAVALLAAAFFSFILAVLVMTETVAVWHIIILSLMGGITTCFNHPARLSIVPNLVRKEHLLNAVSLDNASVQASRFIAMPIAGYLIAGFGVAPVFGARTMGNLLAVCWLMSIKKAHLPSRVARRAGFRNVIDGLKYLRENTLLMALVPLYLIPMLTLNTSNNFLPIFADNVLKIGASGYGFLQAAPGLGSMVTLIALAALPFYRVNGTLLFVTGGILGVALVLFSVSTRTSLSLVLLFITGGMITTFITINTALIQSHVSDAMRGRVISLRERAHGLGPTVSLIFGAVAERTSAPFALILLGIICIAVSCLLAFLLPNVRLAQMSSK